MDIEDVVQSVGTECHGQSVSQAVNFTKQNDFATLKANIDNMQKPCYGVLIGCGRSVDMLFKDNGLSTLADSHVHGNRNSGAMIFIANSPHKLISAYL